MKYLIWIALAVSFAACKSDSSSENFQPIPIEGLPTAFDLMPPEVIKEFLPVGDKELKSHESVLDKRNDKSDGRYWMWMPDEDIRDKEVEGYVQTNAHGVIYVKIEHNPDGPDNWAASRLAMLSKQPQNMATGSNMISVTYEPMEGVGLEAYYANRISQVRFRVNETHLISVAVEYPFSATKRKEIAKELALEVIDQLQNLPQD